MRTLKNLFLAAAIAGPLSLGAADAQTVRPPYKHVLLISVDGMHAVDLTNWLARPQFSWLKLLSNHGSIFPNAFTTAPSDSFPGMIAQVTGASAKTAGVFYDDSYDRTYFAPGSNCKGEPGAETTYAENLDKTLGSVTGGGTLGQPRTQIDPAQLPQRLVNGKCELVYPHQFIRTNTIFEVIKAAKGNLRTAWSDKHPAYEILNGPSGLGIDDLYTPEINSIVPGQTGDFTTGYASVRAYDQTKVKAVLNEIDGLDSIGKNQVGVPSIFGLNFQSFSVGQKLAVSGTFDPPGLSGGYTGSNAVSRSGLEEQFHFIDNAIGRFVLELKARNHYNDTLIIISAKHGQSPIDPKDRVAISDKPYQNIPGYGFHIADDVGLIWLAPGKRNAQTLAQAKAFLVANAQSLGIAQILDQASLKTIYQDPATDSRTPDFVTVSQHGVIYTKGTKLSEHGGFSPEDRNVALLLSAPNLPSVINPSLAETKQIAPTILGALGLDPTALIGVQKEGTLVLPY